MNGRAAIITAVTTFALVAAAQAQVTGRDFSDDFNDNEHTGQWALVQDPDGVVEVAESNERVEITFNESEDAASFAGFVSRDWWFNTGESARFKMDFHFTPQDVGEDTEVGLVLGLTTSSAIYNGIIDDGAEFHYAVDDAGPFTGLRIFKNGTLTNENSFVPSEMDEATVYITYDGESKLLCASLMGYGDQPDAICFYKVFADQQIGDMVISPFAALFIGAYAVGPTGGIDPADAWADNFVIDEGHTVYVASPNPGPTDPTDETDTSDETDQPSTPLVPDTGEPDADGNGRVELNDLSIALRNGDYGPRLLEILTSAGFDPDRYSQQKWDKLMTGLYTHRLRPYFFPRPSKEEKAAAIAALSGLYVGATGGTATADSGTPDANSDGFVNFTDIAVILEGGNATPERLLESLLLTGLDPDAFPRKKYWKLAIREIYDALILPEFSGDRAKKQRKRDQKTLLKLY